MKLLFNSYLSTKPPFVSFSNNIAKEIGEIVRQYSAKQK
jgi:hypothetical protein